MKNNQGFSLVELIVATTIMVVMSVVAMVSYTGTNRRARDSRRAADLQKISMSLEMIRQVGNTYPATLNSLVSGGYMESIPQDPKSFTYYYTRDGNYRYYLYSQMEDLGSTNGSFGSNCGGTCNYRVTSP